MSLLTSFHSFLDRDDWKIENGENFLASSVNDDTFHGDTPLLRVLQNNRCSHEIVKLLLDYGADVNCRNVLGESPLELALYFSREEAIIEDLLQRGAIHSEEGVVHGYICIALQQKLSKEVIKLLLNAGCSRKACRSDDSVFHCASRKKRNGLREGVLEVLLDFNVELLNNAPLSPVCCALHAGCRVQDIQLLMIRRGITLNDCQRHSSPWFCATDQDCYGLPLKTDVVKLIYESGFCLDVRNEREWFRGWSPLQCALHNCDYEIGAVTLMIEKSGVEALHKDGSLLHLAVSNNFCKLDAVKLLVDAGIDVNLLNWYGENPLHRAVMSETSDLPDILKYLLDQGSEVDVINREGLTPLKKLLGVYTNYSAAKVLLEAGASIDSQTLHNLFERYNQSNMLKLLLKFSYLQSYDFQAQQHLECLKQKQDYAEWKDFAAHCAEKARKLDSEILYCKHSLQDFLLGSCKHLMHVEGTDSEVSTQNFMQFLRMISKNDFGVYLEDLSAKVGCKTLKLHLEAKSVYTNCGKKKIRLDSDSLGCLTGYLTPSDLLNMIIAYELEMDPA